MFSSRDKDNARSRHHREIDVPLGLLSSETILNACDRGEWLLGEGARQIAKEAVARAASKVLQTWAGQLENDDRRERYKGDKQRPSNRASLDITQTFERLVIIELEKEEKKQEATGVGLSEFDRVKRFVKHSINVILGHNSYWAAVWVCRILCNYAPKELESFYGPIAPNRAHTKGASECSKVTRKFVRYIAKRFHVNPEDVIGDESDPLDPTDPLVRLIQQTLERFRPTHNSRVLPAAWKWSPGTVPLFPYDEHEPHGDKHVEVDRMGLLLTPSSFNRLAGTLKLEVFEKSLRRLNLWTRKQRETDQDCDEHE